MIEEALVQHLRDKEQVECTTSKDHYKTKFKLVTKGQDGREQSTEICVTILKVDDATNCIEFTKRSGNQVNFHEHCNELIRILNFSNDTVVK